MKKDNIIQVNNLSKRFKSRGNNNLLTGLWRPNWQYMTAVDDVSFAIAKGESVAFLGPNGAGKTTTTKMMTGLIYPSDGSVQVLGFTPFQRKSQFLKRIGLVMGNKASLSWDLTARQSFWLLQHIYDIEKSEFDRRVNELAELLHVTHKLDIQVRRLSLGERMKCELIAAILHKPEVLFLDEPTIGLDIHAKANVREFLRHLQKREAVTIILTSHDMDDIQQVCDRVLVINHGKLLFDDSMRRLMARYSKWRYMRVDFAKRPALAELENIAQIDASDNIGCVFKVKKPALPAILATLSTNYKIEDITIQSTPLETIVSDLFQSEPAR